MTLRPLFRNHRHAWVLMALAMSVLPLSGAAAHGDLASADPPAGARIDQAPAEVRLKFTEPPAAGAQLTITDGCGTRVGSSPTIEGAELSVQIDDPAQPGRWTMSYRFVSDVDGHESQDKLRFTVAGKPDCEGAGGEDPDGGEIDPNPSPVAKDTTGEDERSFPWAVVVGGGVVVIVGGLLLRRIV